MQKEGQLRFLFVINPVSGGKGKADWETQIRNSMRDSPHVMEFFLLTGNDDETSVRQHIQEVRPHRVVAVGGDGTVKLVAGLLQYSGIPLGILPAGSANGMARELNLPLDPATALEVVLSGTPRPIDLILVNSDDICIHLSDIGLNALLVKYFEGSGTRGMWGYARAVLRVLWQKQKMSAIIRTEEDTLRRRAFMIVLANARKYGTGANINPEGDVSDGRFEVVILRRLNLIEILKALFTNRSFDSAKIEVLSTRRVEIQTKRRTYFQVDGEYRGKVQQVSGRILAGAIEVLLPGK